MSKKTSGKPRSAVSGQYVSQDYAEQHPQTTVIEHDKPKLVREIGDEMKSGAKRERADVLYDHPSSKRMDQAMAEKTEKKGGHPLYDNPRSQTVL